MAKVSLERRLTDWAGHAKLAKLSQADVKRAAKELGVSAGDIKAAVAKLNATEFGGAAKRSNALEGSSRTQAPNTTSGSLGYESHGPDLIIMLANTSGLQAAIAKANERGAPIQAFFDDLGRTIKVHPGMNAFDLGETIRMSSGAAKGAQAPRKTAGGPDLFIMLANLSGLQAAIAKANERGAPIHAFFDDLGRTVKVHPGMNAFDLGENIRMGRG